MTGLSSRPGTGYKSSQGMTSIGETPESNRNRSRDRSRHAISDAAKALSETRSQQPVDQGFQIGGALGQADLDIPIELPADVPEEILRQAPVSVKNRLSMTLGIDPKTKADHRVSSVYYPRALGDLLKSPASSQLLYSPQHATSNVATPVSSRITSPEYGLENGAYRPAHPEGRSHSSLAGSGDQFKTRYAMPTAIRGSARASVIDPMMKSQRASNPAFTSHPAVMAMASAPVELPAEADHEEMTIVMALEETSKPDKTSKPDSVQEPGPEMEEEPRTKPEFSKGAAHTANTSVISATGIPVLVEQETSPGASRGEPQESSSHGDVTPSEVAKPSGSDEDEGEVYGDSKESQESSATVRRSDVPNPTAEGPMEAEKAAENPDSSHIMAKPINGSLENVNDAQNTTQARGGYVAELEASAPVELTKSQEPAAPVELEAPFHNFTLPPRPIAVSSNPDKEVPRASIRNLDDFFKLPSETSIKPGHKPREGGKSRTIDKTKPLRLKLAKLDGKIVPVRSSPGDEGWRDGEPGAPVQLLKSDVVADIIETMSNTPPGSPLHQRASSGTSHNSAQRWSHRSTRSLGPLGVAPPPPAPGGRPMVNPDFASAGQFEGERKQKKKKKMSIVSKDKWRLFFQNGNSRALNPSQAAQAEKASRESGTQQGALGTEMMTGSGKDVLWFKGEGKRGVDISTSSG